MNKKILILLILCAGVIIAAAAYELRPQPSSLVVVSTSPANQASHNPYAPLLVTFNRVPKENEVAASVVPGTKTTSTIEGNTMKITPETTFLPETSYEVSLNTSPQYTFRFTTQTDIENAPGTDDITNKANEQYRQQNATQDAALANIQTNAPLHENGFTINYSYANNTYTIALSPPYDQNKSGFLTWLRQSGITDTTSLRITYVNQ